MQTPLPGKFPSLDPFIDDLAKKGTKEKKIDQRGTKAFPAIASGKAGSGVITNNVANAINASDPYDIKVCISYWANFNFSCTGADRWDKAMSKVFYVHIGTNPAEAAMFADIVLLQRTTQHKNYHVLETKAICIRIFQSSSR